jgi:L-alanine-DL-glutamate epimerase-like enolase superfamily enzyme
MCRYHLGKIKANREAPMKITALTIDPCIMRKEDPTWAFALAASPITEGWIVSIHTDAGMTGYGYASATAHMGASMEGMKGTLERLEPILVDRDPADMAAIRVALDRALSGNNQAKAGIDNALFDLNARMLDVPLNRLFGGAVNTAFPVLRILAIKKPAEMASQAQILVDQGYTYLKIKVHGEVADDVARVKAIRKQVGDHVHLTIDANQSYSTKNAIAALNRMAEYNIDLVEQPVPIDDLKGLKLVTEQVPVAVEADESAGSLAEVAYLVEHRIVDAVSLKIAKLGGLWNTMIAAHLCATGNIKYRFGAHVGSRLLNAHAMQLAAALPDVWYACEFGEFARLLDAPFEGIEVVDGIIHLPSGAGSGVQPCSDTVLSRPAA